MPKKPFTDKAGEVRELTEADINAMRPTAEVLPAELAAILPKRKRGQRGPQKAPLKQLVTLRLDSEVVERFRSSGAGWQSRINAVLRKSAGNLSRG